MENQEISVVIVSFSGVDAKCMFDVLRAALQTASTEYITQYVTLNTF